jgi:hypothetical protein
VRRRVSALRREGDMTPGGLIYLLVAILLILLILAVVGVL